MQIQKSDWMIDFLSLELIPEMGMAISKYEARVKAQGIVARYSAAAAAVGWVPGSTFILGPTQYKMVNDIAKCFEVHSYDAQAILTVIASTVAGHAASDALLSWIPIVGWAVKSGTAASITGAAGALIVEHFEGLSPLV